MYYTAPQPMAQHTMMAVHPQFQPAAPMAYMHPMHAAFSAAPPQQPQQPLTNMPGAYMPMPTALPGMLPMPSPLTMPQRNLGHAGTMPMPMCYGGGNPLYAAMSPPSPAIHMAPSLCGVNSAFSASQSVSTPSQFSTPSHAFGVPSSFARSAASSSVVTPDAAAVGALQQPVVMLSSSAAAAAANPLKIPPQGIKLDGTLLLQTVEANRPILADRFRTKMCRNHTGNRTCPYRMRCMFAHTDDELRTPEMNFRDGLYTESAIRAFQERESAARRRQRGPKHNSPHSALLASGSSHSAASGSHGADSCASSASSREIIGTPSVLMIAPTVINHHQQHQGMHAMPVDASPILQVMPAAAFIHQPYAPRPMAPQ
jgi:hypothetical protein